MTFVTFMAPLANLVTEPGQCQVVVRRSYNTQQAKMDL